MSEPFMAWHFLKWKRLLREVTQRLIPTGARPQPRVHFQRRALRLPENTSYSDLTAFLTAASSPSEVDSFPYLRGLDGNGTGNWSLFFSGWAFRGLVFLCEFWLWQEVVTLSGRGPGLDLTGSGFILLPLPSLRRPSVCTNMQWHLCKLASLSLSAVARGLKDLLWAFLCWTKYFSSIGIRVSF